MSRRVQVGLTVAVIIGVGVGGFFLGRATKKATAEKAKPTAMERKSNPNRPQNPPMPSEPVQISIEGLPVKGPREAPVTILEISDFDCPFCSKAFQTVEQLMEAYPGKIRLAFQNMPLSFHRNARPAAEAALAAGDQGKFWEMYERIFTLRQTDRESLINHARALHLDVEKFTKCLDEQCHRKEIDRDIKRSQMLGVRGTPSFFINGRLIVGAQPYEVFKKMVEEELAKAK